LASHEADLARSEVWKRSLDASRARRAAQAALRRRRLRLRGSTGSLVAVALMSGALGAGLAVGHGADRPAAQAAAAGVLRAGSSGEAVAALQRKLGIAADGVFGRQTRVAVRRFQRRQGLTVDGIAGPQTLAALGIDAGSVRRQSGDSGGGGGAPNATLQRIAQCESGGNPTAVSPDGRYRGKYQFDRATWRAMGGSGDPAAAPEAEQDRRAAALLRRRGTAPWGACA
jgi:peptidoglycan hydrolase-like protein with peptidoglycan-binding domain